ALRRVPFDGVEVAHSFPLLAWANLRAGRFNARYGQRAAIGNSDAHVVEAIGKGFTRFPGRTAEELATAIRERRTVAGWHPYGPCTVGAYMRFVWEARQS
ncbi:MAG TPA: PHP-associated domain-containing protein, partial [Chloroflexota bacterium]|nr:PHP-associated domain-containing protein [Chloroflexota bacterium]